MGYALIIGGGTDGRYTISMDIGEAERAELVERFTAQQAEAQNKLAAAQAILAEKTADLDAATLAYNEATTAYIELQRGEAEIANEEQFMEVVDGYFKAQADYIRSRTEHAAALSNKNALSFSASHVTKALADWQAQVLTEARDAWCADLTEDATGYVATLEIPGESDLILIAPGGRTPVLATDGYLRSRSLMAPWQAYFNAAILPGWQKFKPTYRWGTITALDKDADTATVVLADARSSAQRLSVNQASTLVNVPVEYMECNSDAFEIGDNIVVKFIGQDWSAPRVIGFLDNPRECIDWPDVFIPVNSALVVITAGAATRFLYYSFEQTNPEDCEQRFSSPLALPALPSSAEVTSQAIRELRLSYGSAEFYEGPAPLFEIAVTNMPFPYSVGTQTHGAPSISLSAMSATLPPYPGSEISGYEIVISPPKIIKWTSPIDSFAMYEYEYVSEANPCNLVAQASYQKYSRAGLGEQSTSLVDPGQTGEDYLFSLYDQEVIHNGPLYELLTDPTVHVTYHGPRGDVVAEYERVGNVFKKKTG